MSNWMGASGMNPDSEGVDGGVGGGTDLPAFCSLKKQKRSIKTNYRANITDHIDFYRLKVKMKLYQKTLQGLLHFISAFFALNSNDMNLTTRKL